MAIKTDARRLVERIQRALVAGRRDVAELLAKDAIQGNRPHTDSQLSEELATPEPQDPTDQIWAIAGELFKGQPAKWRTLIGKLVKVCHKPRALEVMIDCELSGTHDPTTYIAAAIAAGTNQPGWKMTDDELCAEAEFLGVPTANRKRKELENDVEAARKRQAHQEESGFVRPTTCRFPRDTNTE